MNHQAGVRQFLDQAPSLFPYFPEDGPAAGVLGALAGLHQFQENPRQTSFLAEITRRDAPQNHGRWSPAFL